MKIDQVQARGIKSRDFNHVLSPAVLITGPNDEGKSSILDAIRLAVGGSLPEIGNQNRATWDALCSGRETTVAVKYSDGGVTRRRFYLQGDTVSQDVTGRTDFEGLPLLRAEAYFEMTEAERIDYVFTRVAMPDDFTKEAIIADLRNITLDVNTEGTEKAKNAIIKLCEDQFANPVSVSSVLADLTRDGGPLKKEYTFWNRKQKDTLGAVKTLTDLKTREPECSAEALSDIDAAIEKAQKSLAEVNERRGTLSEQSKSAEKFATRKTEIETALKEEAYDYDGSLAEFRSQLIVQQTIVKKKVDEVRLVKAREELSDAMDAVGPLRTKNTEVCALVLQISSAIEELKKQKCCPYCETASKGWKMKATKNLKARLEPEKKKAKKAGEELDAAIANEDKLRGECEVLATALLNRDTAKARVTDIERDIKRTETEKETEVARINALKKELATLTEIAAPDPKAVAAADAERTQVSNTLTTLTTKREAAVQLRQDIRRAAQSELEHRDAVNRVEVLKLVGAKLKDKKNEMVSVAFTQLLTVANTIASGLLKSPLAVHDDTIGRWAGSEFVPHKGFGGMAKAVTYLAIATALSAQSGLRVAMLDEMGRLDPKRKELMKTNLIEAVRSGLLDQVICVDTTVELPLEGWQIITVEPKA